MQALYAAETQLQAQPTLAAPAEAGGGNPIQPADPELAALGETAQRLLQKHFEQTRQLLVYLIHFIVKVGLYAEEDSRIRSSKLLPTEEDLRVNTKLSGNTLLREIIDLPSWQNAVKECRPDLQLHQELVRKIYQDLKAADLYKSYLQKEDRPRKEEKQIVEYIFQQLLLPNENFIAHLEELFSNWEDDADMMILLINNFLQKVRSYDFSQLISEEKRTFAFTLLSTAIEKKELTLSYITPKLKNWDPERIAQLDMILMRLGVCEFLFFETIPPKVTINEYIDLAKAYSTPQSGQFVNGILDNIHKDLVQENKLHKIAYKPQKHD